MNFFKRLLESRPLTLPELFSLNQRDGLYRGEIAQALRNVILFLAVSEQPKGPFDPGNNSIQLFVMQAAQNLGLFLFSYLDQKSLQLHNPSGFPLMVDFRMISKIMENPNFVGLIVIHGNNHVTYTKPELVKHGLIL